MSRDKTTAARTPERVAWGWQGDDPAAPQRDGVAGPVRLRAAVQTAIAWAIAALLLWLGHETLALVVVCISSVVLLAALISPFGAHAAIDRALQLFARGVATVVGWIVLLPLFFGFFLPFGILFRRGRRDPMRRKIERDAPTYWVEREPVKDRVDRRRRQF